MNKKIAAFLISITAILNLSSETIRDWKLHIQTNDKSRLQFIEEKNAPVPGEVLELSNPSDTKSAVVFGPVHKITEPGLYRIGIWARSISPLISLDEKKKPQLMMHIHQEKWRSGGTRPKYFNLSGDWLQYTTTFHMSEKNLPDSYRMRVCLCAKGAVCLTGPTFERLPDSRPAKIKLQKLNETAHISFDNGLVMTTGMNKINPKKATKTKIRDGFIGNSVMVEDGGELHYPVEETLKGESGTISAWIRADFDPPPTFAKGDPIGIFVTGKNEVGKKSDIIQCNTQSPGNFMVVKSAYGPLATDFFRPQKQFFKDDWRHFIFCWDKNRKINVYLDGHLFRTTPLSQERFSTLDKLVPQLLRILTATDKKKEQTASIDEVKLFNRALTDEEALDLYSQYVPLFPVLLDYVQPVKSAENTAKPYRLRILCENLQKPVAVTAVIEDLDGEKLYEKTLEVAKKADYDLSFQPPAVKDYHLKLYYKNKLFRTFEITAISRVSITDAMPESLTGEVKRELVGEIDCAATYADSRYIDDGHVGVVDSPIGKYREAFNEIRNSGFAYNADIKNPGKPHWLEVEYPDDKPRAFYVVIEGENKGHIRYSQCNSLKTIGIANGVNNPVTGKFQTKRLLFWPDTKRIMIGCFVYKPLSGQAGPALRRIRIYENVGPLPKLFTNPPKNLPNRNIGSWQEDPTFFAGMWFKRLFVKDIPTFDSWREKLKRQIEYLRFTGQNQTVMQLFPYSGDNNGAMGPMQTDNNSRGFLPGWGCLAALIYEREKIAFHIQINDGLVRKGRGLCKMVGEEKRSENAVEAAGKQEKAVELFTSDGELANALNFLHPDVRNAHLMRIRFYRDQFKTNSCFRGVLMLKAEQLTFLDKKTGYGDLTISCFEKDTGINVPVKSEKMDRFGKRYEWLKANAWQKWLKWRCDKVTQFLVEMGRELNLGVEQKLTLICPLQIDPKRISPGILDDYPKTINLTRLYYEMGIDLPRLTNESTLIIEPISKPNYGLLYSDDQKFSQNLDSLWYSQSFTDLYKNNPRPALMLSRHSNMEVYGWDAPIKKYWWPLGYWGINGRMMAFSTALPDNKYLPQTLVWSLANCDPWRIEHGWWGNPENGGVEHFQKFYQAFRAIPAVPFKPVSGVTDPVMVRYYDDTNVQKTWFYVVNQQYYGVKAKLTLDVEDVIFTDVIHDKKVNFTSNTLELNLAPYQICCYRSDRPFKISNVEIETPESEKEELEQLVKQIKKGARISSAPYAKPAIEQAERLLNKKKYSALYYLTRSFSVRELLHEADEALQIKASLNPDKNIFVATFWNRDTDVADIKLALHSPKVGNNDKDNVENSTLTLQPDEKKTIEFPVSQKLKGISAKEELEFLLNLDVNGTIKTKTFIFRPAVAMKSDSIQVDGDLADWQFETWQNLSPSSHGVKNKDRRVKQSFEPLDAKYAFAWNEKGLFLALAIPDKNCVTTPDGKPIWRYDSLEFMIDQKNNARDGIKKLDEDDCVLFVFKQNDKSLVKIVKPAKGQTKKMDEKCQCEIKRVDDKTIYEIFIPATVLSEFDFSGNDNLGFALKLHNRDQIDSEHEEWSIHISGNDYPCDRPDSWNDLLLSHQ